MSIVIRDNINIGFINSQMQPCPRNLKGGGEVPFSNLKSINLDGVDDYINCGNGSALQITSNISVSCWFKTSFDSTGTAEVLISKRNDSLNLYGYQLYIANNTIRFLVTLNGIVTYTATGTTIINDDQWHHVLGTINQNTQISIILDGSTEASNSIGPEAFIESNSPLQLGHQMVGASNYYYTGLMDEVSIFDALVSSTDLRKDGKPANLSSVSNLIAWYRMGDYSTYQQPQILMPEERNKDKISNWSLSFDGVDDYVTTDTLTSLVDNKSKLSISLWINLPNASETNRICGKYIGLNKWIAVSCSTDQVYFIVSGTSTVPSESLAYGVTGAVLTDNTWHHVVCVFDGTQVVNNDRAKIYVDNVDEALTYNNNFPSATYDFSTEGSPPNWDLARSGLNPTSDELRGNMDEYAIYSEVALTPTMVGEIFNSGTPDNLNSLATTPSPDLWYKLGDESKFTSQWLVPNSALSNYSKFSFQFDGIDDFVQLPSQFTTSGTDWSVSYWLKTNETSSYPIPLGDVGSRYFGLNFNSTKVRSQSTSGAGFRMDSITAINDGIWHHIVWTYNYISGLWQVYVDGNPDNSKTASIGQDIFPIQYFGKRSLSLQFYEGNIDEISYFNTELSVAEILTMYNGGQPKEITGAIAHWRMGEDAYYNPSTSEWNIPDQVGSNDGTSNNLMAIDTLVGEAPNYSGGGVSDNMTIEDREGNAPNSDLNSVSYNMFPDDIETDVP